MATATLGTAANNTLTAIKFAYAGLLPADMATIQTGIKDDSVPAANAPIFAGAFVPGQGQLFIPNRGVLQVLAGDYIAFDVTGWPILISARAAASANWVHNP
jgi:hypothetical protein